MSANQTVAWTCSHSLTANPDSRLHARKRGSQQNLARFSYWTNLKGCQQAISPSFTHKRQLYSPCPTKVNIDFSWTAFCPAEAHTILGVWCLKHLQQLFNASRGLKKDNTSNPFLFQQDWQLVCPCARRFNPCMFVAVLSRWILNGGQFSKGLEGVSPIQLSHSVNTRWEREPLDFLKTRLARHWNSEMKWGVLQTCF